MMRSFPSAGAGCGLMACGSGAGAGLAKATCGPRSEISVPTRTPRAPVNTNVAVENFIEFSLPENDQAVDRDVGLVRPRPGLAIYHQTDGMFAVFQGKNV